MKYLIGSVRLAVLASTARAQESEAPTIGQTASAPRVAGTDGVGGIEKGPGPDGAGSLPATHHGGSTSASTDEDGVLPAVPLAELDLALIDVNGQLVEHGTWPLGALSLDVYIFGDTATIVLLGQPLVTGSYGILNGLPGGQSFATAGGTGCWLIPQEGGGMLLDKIPSLGHGNTLDQAVSNYHNQIDALEAAGCEHMPSSMCD